MDLRLLRQRLDTVPLPIRTRVGSDEAIEVIQSIKDEFHIDPGSGLIAQLILRLMIEDLAPQYFTWEIKDGLHIPPEVAKKISDQVRDKVLGPVKGDFKKISIDISLIGNLEEPARKSGGAAVPMPAPLPTPVSTMKAPAVMPLPITPVAPAGGAPQPWRPTKLNVTAAAPVAPPKQVPAMPFTPAPVAAPAKPAPFMMHQEAAAAAVATGSDFKLNISKDMFKSAPTKPIDIPRPPKVAELEIGKAPLPPKPPGVTSFRAAPLAQSRVVHYTDLRTVVSPGFGPAQPMAPATNITPSPAPTAPVPISPVAPTKPAMPPSALVPTAQTPIAPLPPKPPKVVNFGPEEVK